MCACGNNMDGNVLAERKQTHSMPRCDGEGLIIAFDAFELAAPFYSLLGGSIDAAGRLAEVEGGFVHDVSLSPINHLRMYFLLRGLFQSIKCRTF